MKNRKYLKKRRGRKGEGKRDKRMLQAYKSKKKWMKEDRGEGTKRGMSVKMERMDTERKA